MTTVRQVVDLAGNEVSVCPWHAETLTDPSGTDTAQKTGPKSSASHIVIDNEIHNQLWLNHLLRSDPIAAGRSPRRLARDLLSEALNKALLGRGGGELDPYVFSAPSLA